LKTPENTPAVFFWTSRCPGPGRSSWRRLQDPRPAGACRRSPWRPYVIHRHEENPSSRHDPRCRLYATAW